MKGQLKTLEAFIAALSLLIFLAWLGRLAPGVPELKDLDIKFLLLKALMELDKKNELRELVYSNNTLAIEQKLLQFLPIIYNSKVLICKENEICSLNIEAKEIYSVSYFVATDLKKFENVEILVYVWE